MTFWTWFVSVVKSCWAQNAKVLQGRAGNRGLFNFYLFFFLFLFIVVFEIGFLYVALAVLELFFLSYLFIHFISWLKTPVSSSPGPTLLSSSPFAPTPSQNRGAPLPPYQHTPAHQVLSGLIPFSSTEARQGSLLGGSDIIAGNKVHARTPTAHPHPTPFHFLGDPQEDQAAHKSHTNIEGPRSRLCMLFGWCFSLSKSPRA